MASYLAQWRSPRPVDQAVRTTTGRFSIGTKAAHDDFGGFMFGSMVLAEPGNQTVCAAASWFFERVARPKVGDHASRATVGRFVPRGSRRHQGCPR